MWKELKWHQWVCIAPGSSAIVIAHIALDNWVRRNTPEQ